MLQPFFADKFLKDIRTKSVFSGRNSDSGLSSKGMNPKRR
jgi:hypothetical protein